MEQNPSKTVQSISNQTLKNICGIKRLHVDLTHGIPERACLRNMRTHPVRIAPPEACACRQTTNSDGWRVWMLLFIQLAWMKPCEGNCTTVGTVATPCFWQPLTTTKTNKQNQNTNLNLETCQQRRLRSGPTSIRAAPLRSPVAPQRLRTLSSSAARFRESATKWGETVNQPANGKDFCGKRRMLLFFLSFFPESHACPTGRTFQMVFFASPCQDEWLF